MAIIDEEPRGGLPDPGLFGLSGFEQMRAFLRGRVPGPPLSYLFGLSLTEVGMGSSVFSMPATEWLLPPQGLLYAGCLAPLLDAALGSAVQTTLPPATPYTTFELSISLLRPATTDSRTLSARAEVIFGGKSLALADAFVRDATGRSLAHASSRCFIFPAADDPPPAPRLTPVEEPVYETPHPFERAVEGEILPFHTWQEMSGTEIMDAAISEEVEWPPICHLTGLRAVEIDDGTCTFRLPLSGWLRAPHGNVQGGMIALVADHAIAGAIQSTVPAGHGYSLLDLKVYFVRPVPADGSDLVARGRIVTRGRRTALATADVVNAAGKTAAVATGSAVIVDRPVTRERPISAVDE